jgi:hypothetical protein
MLAVELKHTEGKFKELKLENSRSKEALLFFFISDDKSKLDKLFSALVAKKEYSILHNASLSDKVVFGAGMSTEINCDQDSLLSWTKEMVEFGFSFDCEFDGWEISNENNIRSLGERVKTAAHPDVAMV